MEDENSHTLNTRYKLAEWADLSALSRFYDLPRGKVVRLLVEAAARTLYNVGQLPQVEAEKDAAHADD